MRPHVALSLVCVAHTGEPSETADRDAVWGAESFEPNEPSAHWRSMVNTTERSVLGGSVASLT